MIHRNPLVTLRLKEIRHRERDATPGPWVIQEKTLEKGVKDKMVTTAWLSLRTQFPEPILCVTQSMSQATLWMSDADAEFIVHARDDLPDLMASLQLFGHRVVYNALMRSLQAGQHSPEDQKVLEKAIELCWQIIQSMPSVL